MKQIKHNENWGRWVFNGRNLTLAYNPEEGKKGYDYEIDLEEIFNMEDISGWLLHLTESKDWIEIEDLGNFFMALYDIFDGMYNTFYKEGFDPSEYLKKYLYYQ